MKGSARIVARTSVRIFLVGQDRKGRDGGRPEVRL